MVTNSRDNDKRNLKRKTFYPDKPGLFSRIMPLVDTSLNSPWIIFSFDSRYLAISVKSKPEISLDNPTRSALHILDTTTEETHKLDVYMENVSIEEGIETSHLDRLISVDFTISWSPDVRYIAAGSSEVNQPLAIDV